MFAESPSGNSVGIAEIVAVIDILRLCVHVKTKLGGSAELVTWCFDCDGGYVE